jgi:hypothetical protein
VHPGVLEQINWVFRSGIVADFALSDFLSAGEPLELTMRRMNRVMDEIEGLLKKTGK